MNGLKNLNHIAVLVPDLDQALEFWRDQLGLSLDHIETVSGMNAKIAFLPLGESEIELVQPTDQDSGLARFLDKRGPGLHHICIEVEDLGAKLEDLKEKGVQLIDEQPVTLEDGRQLAFIHPKGAGGVLVELYQLSSL